MEDENYKTWVSGVFNRAAPRYGQNSAGFFPYFGMRLVERAQVSAGQHVLDVATGRGAILFPVAQSVGPLGKVVAIDISEQMLKETAQEAGARGIDWIEFHHMDAESLHFADNAFDLIFCGFALFFFPSLHKTLSEFKRVLKPGGKLAVSTWGADSQLDDWLREEVEEFSFKAGFADVTLFSKEAVGRALKDAAFCNVEVFEESKVFFHTHAQAWWESLWFHGSRATLEQLSPAQIEMLQHKALAMASALDTGTGVPEEIQAFLAIAQK